jgi:hypothetical protein
MKNVLPANIKLGESEKHTGEPLGVEELNKKHPGFAPKPRQTKKQLETH